MRKVVFENMCSEILPSLIKVDNQLARLAEITDINNRGFILKLKISFSLSIVGFKILAY